MRAIKIEYDLLDHMVNEDDVLKDPNKKTTPGPLPGNLDAGKAATKGDVDAGFKEADAVVEGTYGVPVISHQCLESHGLVAEWQPDGGLTVWCSTQATVSIAGQLAGRFGVPPAKVKCITHYMGGGFGSKFSAGVHGIAAAELARRAGAAVKIMLNREEEVTTAGNRPSAAGTVKIGGKKDGSITAYAIDCHGTSGYTGGATVNLNLLPYIYLDAIPNWKRSHSVVLINAGRAEAMRAPGHPQNCVLTEFAVDDLAAKLGIDPLVIRRKNLPPNNPQGQGQGRLVGSAKRRLQRATRYCHQAVRLEGEVAPTGRRQGWRDQARHRHGDPHLGRFRRGRRHAERMFCHHQARWHGRGQDEHAGPRHRTTDGDRNRRRRNPRPQAD